MGIKIINHKSTMMALFFLGVMLFYFFANKDVLVQQSKKAITSQNHQAEVPAKTTLDINGRQAFITSMVNQLQSQHADEISSPKVQASLQDFRNFVLEQFPDNGVKIFEQIISLAFNEHALAILLLVANLDQYQSWYGDNLLTLNEMNLLERKGLIWQQRRSIFGEVADVLWQQEISVEEDKRQTVQQTLELLDKAQDIDMNERLFVLQNTLDEQYANTSQSMLINKGMVAKMYFTLASVQNDLQDMSDDQRRDALAQSRKQLGYSEQSINKLAQTDAKRELRWKNGYEYMNARDQLLQLYEGDELNHKLIDLRQQFFKHEAATITAEENSGFMRYERPRLYGSN